MGILSFVTTLVNLVNLLVTLWLGLYIIIRSGRSQTAWLGTATLWAVGAWFLHNSLQGGITSHAWTDWLGQVMKFSVPLWYHLTCLVRFAISPPTRIVRRLNYVLIFISYMLILFQILESSGTLDRSVPPQLDGPAIHFADRWITASFPLFLGLLTILPALATLNLWIAWRQTHHALLRKQLAYLLLAAVVAFLSGVYSGFAALLQLEIPVFPADIGLGVSVLLLGYGVASYNALLEGRPVGRDALYSAVGLLVVVVIYSVVLLLLYSSAHVTLPALVVVLIAAVVTHALYDGGRSVLDRLFYHVNSRRLRADLRSLATEAGTGGTLEQRLEFLLGAVRQRVEMPLGCIAIRQGDAYIIKAASAPEWLNHRFPISTLQTDTVRVLEPNEVAELSQMSLLVPLHIGPEQIGALLLGSKLDDAPSPLAEHAMLEALADPIAALLQMAQLQEEQARMLDQTVAEFRERERVLEQQQQAITASPLPSEAAGIPHLDEERAVALVEQALRRLHDFGTLGRLPLARLQVIEMKIAAQSPGMMVTPVERGKILVQVLEEAIGKLRPDANLPATHEVPGRAWYHYLILHHSYVLEEPTRDIMGWLYISEGTYNRTRRDALRNLASTLLAMEQAAQR